jgi:hypothetical protein
MPKNKALCDFFPAQKYENDPYCDTICRSFDVYVGAGPTDRR